MEIDLSVVIPVYNEEKNICPLLFELERVLVSLNRTFEVIIVDDGSTDSSPLQLERIAREKDYLKVIFFRRNWGQTAAFDAGFSHASGKIIVTMDSDLQNDPSDLPAILGLMEQGFDFIAGWRADRKDDFLLRTLPSRIANWLIRVVTRTHLHDLGCSLKAYRKDLLIELRLYGEMHRFIGVLLEGLGGKVGELKVNHRPRVAGVSKYNLTRSFKVVLDLLTVWFMQGYGTKPSYIFGGVGSILVGVSGLFAMLVLWQKYMLGVWVHRNPLFVIVVFLSVVGIQFFVMGLLAELIIRTYFESSRQKPYSVAKKLGFEQRLALSSNTPSPSLISPTLPCAE